MKNQRQNAAVWLMAGIALLVLAGVAIVSIGWFAPFVLLIASMGCLAVGTRAYAKGRSTHRRA
ncbi:MULTISPECIES: hypothetical protein [Micrococcales]|uniref:hypothetical protein n=1 Tax=Micrococcales TaxID=85006 RepID=UPI0004AB9607|nr:MULTISPECIES: hypothetical protein [Micrococcales]